jgi:hypothetical protein
MINTVYPKFGEYFSQAMNSQSEVSTSPKESVRANFNWLWFKLCQHFSGVARKLH